VNDGIRSFFLDEIRHNRSLRSLNLSENSFGDVGVRLIQKAVQHHPTLEQFRLSRCQLGNGGIRRLAVSIFAQNLKELDVSCNHLTDGVALCWILQQNQQLERLDVSCNDLRDIGVTSLVSNGFGSLKSLTLNNNHIGPQGAEALGKALAMACSLAELRLNQNPIKDNGLSFLANGPKTNTSPLKRLTLTRCSIGDGALLAWLKLSKLILP
jgi:Ran GTPase-activating protein (RanGAP) involved in mRNA processing and transport